MFGTVFKISTLSIFKSSVTIETEEKELFETSILMTVTFVSFFSVKTS